jgi:hypothetical protein
MAPLDLASYEVGHRDGRASERADVVAWLLHVCERGILRRVIRHVREHIERGSHVGAAAQQERHVMEDSRG